MTALRHTHRQMDWRKLGVEPHRQPRREHNRAIHGRLEPMDYPREPILPPLAVWSMVAVMLFFIVPLIMGAAS